MDQIDDSATNVMICRKSCGTCPTYIKGNLKNYPPQLLFCARGKSKIAGTLHRGECKCFDCDVFKKNHMNFGYYCMQFSLKK
ncbi:MAG: hypothetical protein A4E35_00069 [Methanoregula sp. PtaU1.Bin051]|nr:MAG: hypothetical protein A4E35_00069 [Methanoregula sp. PtaU1.Bin051]